MGSSGAHSMSHSRVSKEFNELVLEAVDEALSVLGNDSVKRAFYYHLEKRANIKRNEIPSKLEAFHDALTQLFYDGTVVFEKRVSKNLYERLHLDFPVEDDWTLTDYVKEAHLS